MDTQFTHISAITEAPMCRRVVIEQLKVLREFADKMVGVLSNYNGDEETYEVPAGKKKVEN